VLGLIGNDGQLQPGHFPPKPKPDRDLFRRGHHALRHFVASWMIELGFTPKRLQALLGHSSVQITSDRYGHLFPSVEDDHAKFARIEHEIGLVA
jgi:integrase